MSPLTLDLTLGAHELHLAVSERAFQPTSTTRLLFEPVHIPAGARVLDLGCGVGPLAIAAALSGAKEVVAVDVMPEACELARKNAELNGVADRVKVLVGDLFEPVKGMTFDVIIDDVSGMADRVARISPWFPAPIPTGGSDGAGPTIRMIEESPEYLLPEGSLYFPALSLANVDRIRRAAAEVYGASVEEVLEKQVPFCSELEREAELLEEMRREGVIDFRTRRSRRVWILTIFKAVKRAKSE